MEVKKRCVLMRYGGGLLSCDGASTFGPPLDVPGGGGSS